MRYKVIRNEIQDESGKYIAHVTGCNIATGRKLAKVCADHLNAEEMAKKQVEIQVKIDAKQHEVEVLDRIVDCMDCVPI